MRKLLIVLGIPIDDLNMEEALERLDEFVTVGRAAGKSHQVATVNADFVVKALNDPELRLLLQQADMATADGMPLVWGSRLLGAPLRGRVTGADMVPALAARAAQKGYSLYLLGAAPGVAARAATILQEQNPGLRIAGVYSPPQRPVLEMDQAIVDQIKAARPDILLVAFGNPKQEKWIGMHAPELGVPVCIGVGGTLDFVAGKTRRAPQWMQQAGLEWVYRLAQEPRRLWKRYVVDLAGFGFFFLRQWWAMRGAPGPAALLPVSDTLLVADKAILRIEGRLDTGNRDAFMTRAEEAFEELQRMGNPPRLVIDLERATFLDSSAIGALVGLSKRAHDAGGELVLAAVPQPIGRVLTLTRLDRFFPTYPNVEAALGYLSAAAEPAAPGRQTRSGWEILATPRRFDAESSPAVTEAGLGRLALNPRLILDMSGTVFLASAGLAAMLTLDRRAKELGGALRIAGCSADARRVIELARLDAILSVYRDVEAAASAR
jgi:N-acetylglucosaminyldiphosphoundecaprenol N-acetyl-beta-D-mannosaminyltransferase